MRMNLKNTKDKEKFITLFNKLKKLSKHRLKLKIYWIILGIIKAGLPQISIYKMSGIN